MVAAYEEQQTGGDTESSDQIELLDRLTSRKMDLVPPDPSRQQQDAEGGRSESHDGEESEDPPPRGQHEDSGYDETHHVGDGAGETED